MKARQRVSRQLQNRKREQRRQEKESMPEKVSRQLKNRKGSKKERRKINATKAIKYSAVRSRSTAV